MSALLVGYARCSTDAQGLTAQRDGLARLDVAAERVYVDRGLTGTNRERPGLREALAAYGAGDSLVVTKLDRLARSLPDARAIADELTARQVSLKRRRVGVRPHRRGRSAAVHSGEYSTAEVANLFGVGRSTVYRALERQRAEAQTNMAAATHIAKPPRSRWPAHRPVRDTARRAAPASLKSPTAVPSADGGMPVSGHRPAAGLAG